MKKILIVILSITLFSCCTFKKVQTKIITDTIIKIDTIIKVQRDTITLIKSVRIVDTAYLENTTSIARSYYSTKQQKVVLELKGKAFDVPITVYKHTTVTNETKEKVPVKSNWLNKIITACCIFLIGMIIILIIKLSK
jgi:hypothetical protein